jgi:hypothetical protein
MDKLSRRKSGLERGLNLVLSLEVYLVDLVDLVLRLPLVIGYRLLLFQMDVLSRRKSGLERGLLLVLTLEMYLADLVDLALEVHMVLLPVDVLPSRKPGLMQES